MIDRGIPRIRERDCDGSGSVLVLVVVLLVCVGLIATAAIQYAGTSLKATTVYTTRRAQVSDAEAAIRVALQYAKADQISGGTLAADAGGTCNSTFSYPGSTGTVTVSVCPQTGSLGRVGNIQSPLLTLAPPGSGQGIDQQKNSTWNVNGDVWSNSYIHVTTLKVAGKATAWTDCSGSTITATDGKDCAASTTYGGVVPSAGMDPGDPSLGHAADWAPAAPPGSLQTPSSCNLQPGVYTSGTALTSACSGSNSIITLAAGVYYLNFPSSASTWTIFGNLQGPSCTTSADPGVQFVLANNAQIVNYGTINIPCGGRAASPAPRISFLGLKTATASASGTIPAQTGCVIHGVCPVISSGGSSGQDSFTVPDSSVYIPQSTFTKVCKNSCDFNVGQALVAWSATLDANPSSASPIIFGAGLPGPGPGKVVFQAFVGGTDRIDAYVTFDAATHAPTISSWVIH